MKKYKIIEKALAEKNKASLKRALGNIIFADRNFSTNEFNDVFRYINDKIEILEPTLIGELISEEKSEYNDSDFNNAVFELTENFCKERIEDVKKIGRTLYPIQKPTLKGETQSKKDNHHQNKKSLLPIIMLGILVVGILLIWVGLLSK